MNFSLYFFLIVGLSVMHVHAADRSPFSRPASPAPDIMAQISDYMIQLSWSADYGNAHHRQSAEEFVSHITGKAFHPRNPTNPAIDRIKLPPLGFIPRHGRVAIQADTPPTLTGPRAYRRLPATAAAIDQHTMQVNG